ncbi:hypothetical protein GCM10011512_01020 [Tersicoccus solisilvae]|uniref:Uncharacterized protein n=1 Tax=Tersicoccus solisilvae TaxID=1882339 RepID=A0ABQ1NIU5_9MICC|nr:hypothetical protein GCM10011512_01020 [Tersicoccus solisilvae]
MPGSARVASVNARLSSGHWSAYSGFTGNLTQMKIMVASLGLRLELAHTQQAPVMSSFVRFPGMSR